MYVLGNIFVFLRGFKFLVVDGEIINKVYVLVVYFILIWFKKYLDKIFDFY